MLKQDKKLKNMQSSAGSILVTVPLSPNQWTILSLIIAVAAGYSIAFMHEIGLGVLLFALAALMDAADGAVARAKGQVSAFGGFLDGVVDRFVEATFLFSLMLYPLPTIAIDPKLWLALVLFLGASIPSFIRAYADHKGVVSREQANGLGGICERTERLTILVVGLLAGIFYSMDFFIYSLILVVLLSTITILQRVAEIYKIAGKTKGVDESAEPAE